MHNFEEAIDQFTPIKLKALLRKTNNDLEFVRAAFDSLGCSFIVVDLKSKIIIANKYTYAMFRSNTQNTNGNEWLHQHISDVFPKCGAGLKERILDICMGKKQEVVKGEVFDIVCPIMNEHFCLMLSIYPHIIHKKIQGWIIVIQDNTEKRIEEQVKVRSELLSTVTQISTSVAHEIKNPLGAMSIHLQLLQKNLKRLECGSLNDAKSLQTMDRVSENIHVIEEEIENMNNVIGLFLNNLNIEKNDLTKHNINDILDSLIKFVAPDLEQRNIELILNLTSLNTEISASKSSVIHVFLNLVKNSMEEMPDGGTITIKSYLYNGRVRISISDTGKGISEEMMEKIFKPYATSKEQGTGIGLTIADKIMHMHNGHVFIDTRYKDGACFVLDFPSYADEQHLLPPTQKEKINEAEK